MTSEFNKLTNQELYKKLKNQSQVSLKTEFGNLESKKLIEKAKNLLFKVSLNSIDRSSYLPIKASVACLIEHEELASQITRKMLSVGVPVNHINVD